MTVFALLFTLASLGVSETAYLIRQRLSHKHAVCPIGESCTEVLESEYNHTFIFFHNDIAGFLFYISLMVFTAITFIEMEPVRWWEALSRGLVASGSVFSLYLIYLQWRVIKAWCFWCVMSACTIFAMGLILMPEAFSGVWTM